MRQILHFLIIIIFLFSCETKEKKSLSNLTLETKVDSLVKPYLDNSKIAGIAVGAFKGKESLLLKSYGFADLEFDVKLPVNASFEIGSVTKQFTAAAILQLAEKGKLSLDDDINKFIIFNTHGKKVTIRHLLSHTSGIKGYTELPMFEKLSMQKYSRDTLLRIVEKEPFDFNPGEALVYSNTGFFMLGLIIEKVSGLSYDVYIVKNLFEKAGMTNSYYCSESRVIKNRAHGYDTKATLVRAGYLDHNWPFAAGSICSTIEDLCKWNDALHHGRILGDKMYKEFITPASLNDGTLTHYAKGITVTNYNGKQLISHGGGINGFLSYNSYFPEQDLSIVVLINTTGPVSPVEISRLISNFIFGVPSNESSKFKGEFAKFLGSYKGRGRGEDLSVNVTKNDSTISIQIGKDKPKPLNYLHDNTWSDGFSTYHFGGTENLFKELRIDQTYGYYILKRVTN